MKHDGVDDLWSRELAKGLSAQREAAFEAARGHFERAFELAPAEPIVCYALGREFARSGDSAAAAELLESAWKSDPSLLGAAATLARCYGIELGQPGRARTLLDQAEQKHGPDALLDIVRGEISAEAGNYEAVRDAIAAVERKVSSNAAPDTSPKSAPDIATTLAIKMLRSRADNLEGIELASSGQHETALFLFRRASNGDDLWAAPKLNAALSFLAVGNQQAALTNVDAAIACDCNNLDAMTLRADLLARSGRHEAAKAQLAATTGALIGDLAAAPTNAASWLRLGRAQLAADAIGAGEECLRQSLELDEDNPEALSLLADLLVRDGRYLEATALAERCQALDSDAGSRYLCSLGSSSPGTESSEARKRPVSSDERRQT